MTRYTTLIGPSSAIDEANSVKFLDCRASLADPEMGRRVYSAGHIAGAGYLSLDDDLADLPGDRGRHPLPDPTSLAAKLQRLGINDSDQVIVYDDVGGAFAARAWWCLRWLGHEAVALLDGGLSAWPAPLSAESGTPQSGDFSIRKQITRTIDADALCKALEQHTLIDARSEARFNGTEEPIDPIAGHIPGAICRPFQENLNSTGRFKSPATLLERFDVAGTAAVCYCGSGVTAAHNILAMRVAGLPEPLLYAGSWSEWIRSDSRPRTPGVLDTT
jgi:thiosulfate/3-mercaptopyruvate sulfurtransferase